MLPHEEEKCENEEGEDGARAARVSEGKHSGRVVSNFTGSIRCEFPCPWG